jgi:hypothetical protein
MRFEVTLYFIAGQTASSPLETIIFTDRFSASYFAKLVAQGFERNWKQQKVT